MNNNKGISRKNDEQYYFIRMNGISVDYETFVAVKKIGICNCVPSYIHRKNNCILCSMTIHEMHMNFYLLT